MSRRCQTSKRNRNYKKPELLCDYTKKIEPNKELKDRGFKLQIGEVILANINEAGSAKLGRRPCIVLGRGGSDNLVEVVPLTKSRVKYSGHVLIVDKCLKAPSTVLCDNLHTIDKMQVSESWGRISKHNFNLVVIQRQKMLSRNISKYYKEVSTW